MCIGGGGNEAVRGSNVREGEAGGTGTSSSNYTDGMAVAEVAEDALSRGQCCPAVRLAGAVHRTLLGTLLGHARVPEKITI